MTSAMNVPGYIVYGNDHGTTPILCSREVKHFRRSWFDHEGQRCTAIYIPHGSHDEEDYIKALETVRDTLTKGREAGAMDFFVGGDRNIELRLGNAGEDLHGLDSIGWYGLYGPRV